MKGLTTKTKVSLLAASILTFVAFAETYYDFRFYSDSFMEGAYSNIDLRVEETQIRSRSADTALRVPSVQSVDLNKRFVINGDWEVVRLVFAEDETFEEVSIDVRASLINQNQVRINNQDTAIDFYISEFREGSGKMVLFQTVDGSLEILELRKKLERRAIPAPSFSSNEVLADAEEVEEMAPKFDILEGMRALSAVNPVKSRQALWFDNVEGQAELRGSYLTIDGLSLNYGKEKSQVITMEAPVSKMGMFDYEVAGIEGKGLVSQVGDNEVQIRFSTGMYAPISVTFVTNQKYDVKLAEKTQQTGGSDSRRLAADSEQPVENYDNAYPQDSYPEDNYEEAYAQDSYEPSDVEERREEAAPQPVVLNPGSAPQVAPNSPFLSEEQMEDVREQARLELLDELDANGELNLKEGEGYRF